MQERNRRAGPDHKPHPAGRRALEAFDSLLRGTPRSSSNATPHIMHSTAPSGRLPLAARAALGLVVASRLPSDKSHDGPAIRSLSDLRGCLPSSAYGSSLMLGSSSERGCCRPVPPSSLKDFQRRSLSLARSSFPDVSGGARRSDGSAADLPERTADRCAAARTQTEIVS